MEFLETEIPDVKILIPKIYADDRGYFFETFRDELIKKEMGINIKFCQDNESKSKKGVFRGLHYQLPPFSQTKLIRVIKGKILDIIVDLRVGSPFFGKSLTVELNDLDKNELLIPRGFAHGFLVLEDNTIFSYKVDNYYTPTAERGILFNDHTLNIDWKGNDISNLIISPKDKILPLLSEVSNLFNYGTDYYE
ncbi:dTDP-4-dehydrorhamnose 3,5-epimerase [Francisella halioticida]|uniref:dTDP-4-dehydrorhamnose 3,5-epimerase n=1 Tax=Francisella halioticida TaxID=549298 RepID=A0ABN5B1T0_9GAMM|nr:dTDP-4-dehydrorhamnose 3,5-epimerase [Francisella halioticida]ASG68517.1 dTDP-4-dehydrorhamnose 3,5-epimerase [Francisella halioticida]BCD91411.1 dTDP-4-dehydrorhamnose 3,5-epimerase [Francisella halioticida]